MSRVWDENWFGPTRTLDVHVGILRKKLGETIPPSPRFIHTVRGVGFRLRERGRSGSHSLRARLLLALAYVLVLAIVSLEIPLGFTLRDRVDSEVRSQAPRRGRRGGSHRRRPHRPEPPCRAPAAERRDGRAVHARARRDSRSTGGAAW